jgi:hypothetical protein
MSHRTQTSGSKDLDYKELSLPLRLVAGWTIGLFVSLAGVLGFVYFVYGTPHMHPVPEVVTKRPMNQPALQVSAVGDLAEFQARQQAELSTYGWVNKSQGVVRLPINQAIDLVLQKGFQARGGKQ